MSSTSKNYIGYADLESLYGIKKGTAYSLVSQKKIPHVRLGKRYVLFSREEIDRWFSTHEIPYAANLKPEREK
jgi:excisionase family DNA binding protein